jgi:hypothetical protein
VLNALVALTRNEGGRLTWARGALPPSMDLRVVVVGMLALLGKEPRAAAKLITKQATRDVALRLQACEEAGMDPAYPLYLALLELARVLLTPEAWVGGRVVSWLVGACGGV